MPRDSTSQIEFLTRPHPALRARSDLAWTVLKACVVCFTIMATVRLTIKFANFDNTTSPLLLEIPETTTCLALKAMVVEKWPAACPRADGLRNVILIAMGKQLEDSKSLVDSQLPRFDWPTPIHACVRQAAKAAPVPVPAKAAPASVGNPHAQHVAEDHCCIIM